MANPYQGALDRLKEWQAQGAARGITYGGLPQMLHDPGKIYGLDNQDQQPVSGYGDFPTLPSGYSPMENDLAKWQETEYRTQFDANGILATNALTSVRGPRGEKLPDGAMAFDYYGNVMWSDNPVVNFARSWQHAMQNPATQPPAAAGPIAVPGGIFNEEVRQKIEETGEGGGNLVEDWWYNTFENFEPGGRSPLSAAVITVNSLAQGVVAGFDVAAKATKQTASVFQRFQEKVDNQDGLPFDNYQYMPPEAAAIIDQQMGADFRGAYNRLRERDTKNPGSFISEVQDTAREGWEAGKIFYTGVLDPLAREEFIRRYRAGENPTLLAQELENPLAEVAGELVFDPLNLLAAPAKAAKFTGEAADAARRLTNLAPEVEKALDALRAGDELTDVKSIEGIMDFIKAQGASVAKATDRLDNLTGNLTLKSLTANGKRTLIAGQVGDIARNAAKAHNPAQFMDTMEAWVKLSGNEDDVADAMAVMRNSPMARLFLSDAGTEGSVILRRLLTDDTGKLNPKAFIKGLAEAMGDDDTEKMSKLAAHMLKKVDDAAVRQFPTVQEMVKTLKKLEAGDIAKLPPGFAQVGLQGYKKHITALDHLTRTSPLYKGLQGFFSFVYMGVSPAFAFRNLMTNLLVTATDEGIGAAARVFSPKANAAWLEKNLGWIPETATAGFGSGTLGAEEAPGLLKKLSFGSNLSEKFEQMTAMSVVRSAAERSMRKLAAKALPNTDILTDVQKTRLMNLVAQNGYDVNKAAAQFAEEMGAGWVDTYKTLNWVDPKDADAMHGFGIYDTLQEAVNNPDPAEGQKLWRAKLKELEQFAKDAGKEAPAPFEGAPSEIVSHMAEAGLGDEAIVKATDYYNANHLYFQSAGQLVSTIRDQMRAAGATDEMFRLFDDWEKLVTDADVALRAGGQRQVDVLKEVLKAAQADFSTAQEGLAKIGMRTKDGPIVPVKDFSELKDTAWRFVFGKRRADWNAHREEVAVFIDNLLQSKMDMPPNFDAILARYTDDLTMARAWDDYLRMDEIKIPLDIARTRGPKAIAAVFARQFNISSATDAGVPLDAKLLNIINANLDEGMVAFEKWEDVPEKVIEPALRRHALKQAGVKNLPPLEPMKAPDQPMHNGPLTYQRVVAEQIKEIRRMFKRVEQGMAANFGAREAVGKIDGKAFARLTKEYASRIAEARQIAGNIATEARRFTLLDYRLKHGYDLALSYVYPYHFWYTRTYGNWLKRIVYNPEAIAAYAKYREFLEKQHANLPEWWRYNVNTKDLLGVDLTNPMFFNLEATLNPVNGLTGVDFNDPEKRVNLWTAVLDDLNKFGPSVFTPITLATAIGLKMMGQEEAAARWGGRMIPSTATIKSAAGLMNLKFQLPGGGVNELDPNVLFFGNGLDPYERRKVGQMLGSMIDDGTLTREQAYDIAKRQDPNDPNWQEAQMRNIRERGGWQLLAQMFGVGFKARTKLDMAISQAYQEYYGLMRMRPDMSPEEYRKGMDAWNARHPYMQVVLLTREAGPARDTAYAWNVLSRIPPGNRDDLAKAMGIDYEAYFTRFYNDKGDMRNWPEADRNRWMQFMVDVGAVLALPDEATKAKWNAARDGYNSAVAQMQAAFGKEILARINLYFDKPDDQRAAYLAANPDVAEAMRMKDRLLSQNPDALAYYGSIDTVERYYGGMVKRMLKTEFPNIEQTFAEYDAAKLVGYKEAAAYRKAHPEIQRYFDLLDTYQKMAAASVTRVADILADPEFEIRPDAGTGIEQQKLLNAVQPQRTVYDIPYDQFRAQMSPPLAGLVDDFVYGGQDLSEAAQKQLERLANQYQVNIETLLEILRDAANR